MSNTQIDFLNAANQLSSEFAGKLKKFEAELHQKHLNISRKKTPAKEIRKDPMGFDYVSVSWMTDRLNEYYPIWSWKEGTGFKIYDDWVIVDGVLTIIDNGIPREFYSVGAARVQYKKGMPRTPENIIDMDNTVAAALAAAFKRAINRLGNIADDVYRRVMNSPATAESIEKIRSLMQQLDPEKQQLVENYLLEKKDGLLESEAQRLIERIAKLMEEQHANH